MQKELLMIPGPTPVPPRVLQAMAAPMVNHRGSQFAEVFHAVSSGMKKVFKGSGDVVIFPAAGTGALEAAVVNTLSKEDRVLAVVTGEFGSRFANAAERFGVQVNRLEVEWGKPADPDLVGEALSKKTYKAILLTHNETSTGITNPIKEIAEKARGSGALVMVDAISSLAAIDLRMDEWDIDMVIAGSQKGLMTPPGLSMICLNEKAWKATESSNLPKLYWDLAWYRKGLANASPPYTPAVSLWFALREALVMIEEEGLDNIFRRHLLLRDMCRAAVSAVGLELLTSEKGASATVTAVKVPNGLKAADLRKTLRSKYGIVVAGGQGHLKETIFRIGHVGYVTPMDMIATVAALEMSLVDLGLGSKLGNGVKAAEEVLENSLR